MASSNPTAHAMSSVLTLPLPLPSVDGAAARLQAMAGLARLNLAQWRARLPEGRNSHGARHDAPVLRIESPAGRLWLQLDAGFDALEACARLHQPAQRDAVTTLLAAEELQRWLPELGDCQASFGSAPAGEPCGVSVQLPGRHLTLLGADAPLMEAVQAVLQRHPATDAILLARCGALRLQGDLLLARRVIPRHALARLRPGDVVLTERRCSLREGRPALTGRNLWRPLPAGIASRRGPCAWTEVEDKRMTLETPFDWLDDEMAMPGHASPSPAAGTHAGLADGPAPEAAPASDTLDDWPREHTGPAREPQASTDLATAPRAMVPLNELELPLEIALPAPVLSLTELAALTPGATLALPCRIDEASVRLSVQGQLVGVGELVAISGCLGVRIVRLAGALNTTPGMPSSTDAGAAT